MELRFEKRFKKQYKKLPTTMRQQFDERVVLLLQDPLSPRLRLHPLKGAYVGYWSMNVSGDLRALYRRDGETVIIFALIGTHSQLFG